MSLIRWNRGYASPMNLIQDLHEDLARILEENPLRAFAPVRWGLNTGAFVPPMDLYDHADHLLVRVDLPGMSKDSIEVSVVRNTLTIRGEKQEERNEGKSRSERLFGSFSRSIALPVSVEADKVTAAYKNGVLEITLPKAPESKPRKVAVNS